MYGVFRQWYITDINQHHKDVQWIFVDGGEAGGGIFFGFIKYITAYGVFYQRMGRIIMVSEGALIHTCLLPGA